MKVTTDVDIDVQNRNEVLYKLPHVKAVIIKDDKKDKHNTGVYFQPIPKDPLTNLSLVDHHDAEGLGYFKIDFLNVNVYNGVRDEEHLDKLLNTEPEWALLESEEFVNELFHISNYAALLKKLKPTSIAQLAAVLAIIRPAKRHLEDSGWDKIMQEVWLKPKNDAFAFKKAHGIAYSCAIVVQMNLIIEELSDGANNI